MKKTLLCMFIALALTVSAQLPKYQTEETVPIFYKSTGGGTGKVQMNRVSIDGMEFAVMVNVGYQSGGLVAINLTKKKLEVELLQKQLSASKKK